MRFNNLLECLVVNLSVYLNPLLIYLDYLLKFLNPGANRSTFQLKGARIISAIRSTLSPRRQSDPTYMTTLLISHHKLTGLMLAARMLLINSE